MKSIIQSEKECYICKTTLNLHRHHMIEGTANRRLSEKYGLTIYLCEKHHRQAHSDHFRATIYHREAQRAFERVHGDRSAFMAVFGRNYLDGGMMPPRERFAEIDPVERTREAQEEQG